MQRVSVIGSAGAGKTAFARELARRIGAPHLELDGVFHQAGWRQLDRETFQLRVKSYASAERWVIDGNYSRHGVSDLIWARAENVLLWAWTRHAHVRSRYEGYMHDGRWTAQRVIRLRARREVDRFLDEAMPDDAGD